MDRNAVLVVDDEDGIRDLIALSLEDSGRKVYAADTPRHALQIVDQQADIGLAVLDIRMPEMTGIELWAEIGKQQPEIKVMFITGYSDHVVGDHTVITKPFRITRLLQVVEEKFVLIRAITTQ